MVYGRQIDGQVTTFGTTGYTHKRMFLLYDRRTETIWYPLEDGAFDAISGLLQGKRIDFIDKPPVVTLGQWKAEHPDTLVLLGEDVNP